MTSKYNFSAALIITACLSLSACNDSDSNTPNQDPTGAGDYVILKQDNTPLASLTLSTGAAVTQAAKQQLLGSTDQATAGVAEQAININYKKSESKPHLLSDNKDHKLPSFIKVSDKGNCAAKDASADNCEQFIIQYAPLHTSDDFINGNITFSNSSGQINLAASMRVPELILQAEAANRPAILAHAATSLPAPGSVVYSDDLSKFKIHISTYNHLMYKSTGYPALYLKLPAGEISSPTAIGDGSDCALQTLAEQGCDLSFDLTHAGTTMPADVWYYGLNNPIRLFLGGVGKPPLQDRVINNGLIYPFKTHEFFIGTDSEQAGSHGIILHANTATINQDHNPSPATTWTPEDPQLIGSAEKVQALSHINILQDSWSIDPTWKIDGHANNPLDFQSIQQPIWESFTGGGTQKPNAQAGVIDHTNIRLAYLFQETVRYFPNKVGDYSQFQAPGKIIATATSGTPKKQGDHNFFVYLSYDSDKDYHIVKVDTHTTTSQYHNATLECTPVSFKVSIADLDASQPISMLVSGDGTQILLAGKNTKGNHVAYTATFPNPSQSTAVTMATLPENIAPQQSSQIVKWVTYHDTGYSQNPQFPGNYQSSVLLGLSTNHIDLYRFSYLATGKYQLIHQNYKLSTPLLHLSMINHVSCTSENFDLADVLPIAAASQRRCFFYGSTANTKTDPNAPLFDVEVYRGLDMAVYTKDQPDQNLVKVAQTPQVIWPSTQKPIGEGISNMTLDADTGNILFQATAVGNTVYMAKASTALPQGKSIAQLNYYSRDTKPINLPGDNMVASLSVH